MSGAGGPGADVLERDAELARIEAAVARAQEGHGSLLVVEGPAGIGKSALIGAARALSDAAGARTLRVTTCRITSPPHGSDSIGPSEMRPRDGFKPNSPHMLAGMRIDPPPSPA